MPTSTPLVPSQRQTAGGPDPGAREVVVGVDGSECALNAVRWAAAEAQRRGAPLRIVHAAPYLAHRRGSGAEPPPQLARARQIVGAAFTVARHAERDLPATTDIVADKPAPALLRAAAAGQLVVLGSATTGAVDEMVLAPVVLRVAARSPQPVVVVPRRRGGSAPGRPVVAVLGIGDPDDDAAVAEFAASAAERTGTPLSLLLTPSVDGWAGDPAEWDRRFPGTDVERTELPSAGARRILEAACPAPLLVFSAGHGDLLHRGLDGPHRWLLRHCTSPMALVPPVHRPELEPHEEIVAVG
ncbi:universal stress protein [Blastococcus saxobsidens]|uniref:Putative universal stress protein A n=1 Tax=Blastococcus saxobsidens (strain DD2) TaxID=1146883 RepID=H6RQP0_BLASD|nr:universal stress protein [Blastococcus saxobsidens]CCG01567.1 Putative universal stress protein A [Blastococcus saxobsidens DD2]